MEKVSIIIPVYNSELTLDRCLNSVRLQTYDNIEIIVIDDGSTDSSFNIISKHAENDCRVKIFQQQNSGVAAARNRGIRYSTSMYMQFVDSDDSLEPNATFDLLSEMITHDVDLVICGLIVIKENEILRRPHIDSRTLDPRNIEEDLHAVMKIFPAPCNKLYKKKNAKFFDERHKYGEDLQFNIRYIGTCQSVRVINTCLYNVYLDNSSSLNRRISTGKLKEIEDWIVDMNDELNMLYGHKLDKSYWGYYFASIYLNRLRAVAKSIRVYEFIKFLITTKQHARIRLLVHNVEVSNLQTYYMKELSSALPLCHAVLISLSGNFRFVFVGLSTMLSRLVSGRSKIQ